MKIKFCFHLLILLFLTAALTSTCNATSLDREIQESYINSDFATTAKLIENKIHRFKEKAPAGHRGTFQNIYMSKLLLAHIYAWKLNKPDKSLNI